MVYSNDNTWMTFDLVYGKVKLCNLGFSSTGKSENNEFFRNYCSM